MDLGLKGHVALVTGGSRGIGRAVAATLAAEGASVAIVARSPNGLREAAQSMSLTSGRIVPIAADIARDADAARAIDETIRQLGRLDVVISGASEAVSVGQFPNTDFSRLRTIFDVKFFGTLLLLQHALPYLRTSPAGAAILLSGISAHYPAAGDLAFSTVNAAVLAAMRSLAVDLAPEVRVVAVTPGPTRTDRWDGFVAARAEQHGVSPDQAEDELLHSALYARVATPDDVAYVVAMLASPRAASITGTEFTVNGGRRWE